MSGYTIKMSVHYGDTVVQVENASTSPYSALKPDEVLLEAIHHTCDRLIGGVFPNYPIQVPKGKPIPTMTAGRGM